jgi:hypothetical protein
MENEDEHDMPMPAFPGSSIKMSQPEIRPAFLFTSFLNIRRPAFSAMADFCVMFNFYFRRKISLVIKSAPSAAE